MCFLARVLELLRVQGNSRAELQCSSEPNAREMTFRSGGSQNRNHSTFLLHIFSWKWRALIKIEMSDLCQSTHMIWFFYFAVNHKSSMSSEGISSSGTTILCDLSKPSKDIVYSLLLNVMMVPTNHPSQFPLASAVSTLTLLLRSEPFPVKKWMFNTNLRKC